MKNLKGVSFIITLFFLSLFHSVRAQEDKAPTSEAAPKKEKVDSMSIYGFAMGDAGYNFNNIDPLWFDVVRPTKLPAYKNQFGSDGNTFFSVRQSRLGVKSYFNTRYGQMKTIFEIDMFGVGVDAGETTIRLRHAYGELGRFGAGQTHSPFMDIDVFPNILDYWGPNGMIFFRNVQIRYMPIQKEHSLLTFALERPGASQDMGRYTSSIELDSIEPRFPLPDFSAEYRQMGKFGYVRVAGIIRRIMWKDQNPDSLDLSGGTVGWGFNVSTNLNLGKKDIFRGQFVYGRGIQSYINDAPSDVALKEDASPSPKPVKAVPIPMISLVAFLEHTWSEKFSTTLGYSMLNIDNPDGQSDDAFHKGQYAIVNLLYYPTDNLMAGIEYQWAKRDNFRDGWDAHLNKIQVSVKYKFSQYIYRRLNKS
ncbi:DcaP family trimeric outer membrane transporter [Sporocytophaga myxococcoides]|uniref:DcaP family trimeric outer membrane transporter n=1 Tax=Sporocytophaga myxococcoides TaxID=153721 RepID=UPI00040DF67C|nr:DcaP family trimeric outer membrane transporter [Sporocytophaga myxococcoides]